MYWISSFLAPDSVACTNCIEFDRRGSRFSYLRQVLTLAESGTGTVIQAPELILMYPIMSSPWKNYGVTGTGLNVSPRGRNYVNTSIMLIRNSICPVTSGSTAGWSRQSFWMKNTYGISNVRTDIVSRPVILSPVRDLPPKPIFLIFPDWTVSRDPHTTQPIGHRKVSI